MEKAINGKSDKQYFYQIWHRRAGKDKTNIADVVPRRLISSSTLVKYVYPTLVMGRDNLWDGIGSDGFPYIQHIPPEIIVGQQNNTRMVIRVKPTNSIFQVAGSDNPDSLRGGNAKLYIFSEWAEQDPYALDVIEPIIKENGGIVIFNTTPKGDNHARALYEFARNHPKWFVDIKTVMDTKIFSLKELEEIKSNIIKRFITNGRSEEEAMAYFDQEYMCSFDSPVVGSYYGAAMRKAEQDKRIGVVNHDSMLLVNTVWDLGVGDSNVIWFYQVVGKEIRIIDYYESSGEGLQHYINILQQKHDSLGYQYDNHFAPHDIAVKELGTGKTRWEIAKSMGVKFKVLSKNFSREDGIETARSILINCWFDESKCIRGIQALKNYKKLWDEKNNTFKDYPHHDWSSHAADAFRYLAIAYKHPHEYNSEFIAEEVSTVHLSTNFDQETLDYIKKEYGLTNL